MYYIPSPQDNRRATNFIILLIILFIIICFISAPAQMSIVKNRIYDPLKKDYISVAYPAHGNQFGSPTSKYDTITMTIRADDVGKGNAEISLWVQYPLATKADSLFPILRLDFDNGYTCTFVPLYYYVLERKIQYRIDKFSYEMLRKNKFTHVVFGSISQAYCRKPDPYFKDFLSMYNK